MKTVNNSAATTSNSNWSLAPKFYMNSGDSKLGIVTLSPSIEPYWDKMVENIDTIQTQLHTVKSEKTGNTVLMNRSTVVGVIGGKPATVEELNKFLSEGKVEFNLQANSKADMEALFA